MRKSAYQNKSASREKQDPTKATYVVKPF